MKAFKSPSAVGSAASASIHTKKLNSFVVSEAISDADFEKCFF